MCENCDLHQLQGCFYQRCTRLIKLASNQSQLVLTCNLGVIMLLGFHRQQFLGKEEACLSPSEWSCSWLSLWGLWQAAGVQEVARCHPQACPGLGAPRASGTGCPGACIPAEPCIARSGCASGFPSGVRWGRVRNTVGKEKGILSGFVLAQKKQKELKVTF